jgi:hypothetical protein
MITQRIHSIILRFGVEAWYAFAMASGHAPIRPEHGSNSRSVLITV